MRRAIRAKTSNPPRSRPCCRGMRPARCAAATVSASRQALRNDPEPGAPPRSGPRRARRDHSPQRNAWRAGAARRGPAHGGDRRRSGRRAQARPGAAADWLTGFFANLSPRTLAVAASFATLAIALQAVMIVDIFTKPESSSPASRAWRRASSRHICDGALRAAGKRRRDHEFPAKLSGRSGRRPDRRRALSRAHRGDERSPKKRSASIIARMRHEPIVESAEPAEAAEAAEPSPPSGARSRPRNRIAPTLLCAPGAMLPRFGRRWIVAAQTYPAGNAGVFSIEPARGPVRPIDGGNLRRHRRASPLTPAPIFQTRPVTSPPGGSSYFGFRIKQGSRPPQ